MNKEFHYDVLIIGSGAAGLTLALSLPEPTRIAILSKVEIWQGSTFYAQGGISAALDKKDSFESHIQDTLISGAGLCHEDTVRFVVERGPKSIHWLEKIGVSFTQTINSAGEKLPHLTREGGHSHRRVIHAEDATGKEVETSLLDEIKRRQNIDTFEHHSAIDLITSNSQGHKDNRCIGAYILNTAEQVVNTFLAPCVVLATGGASKVYLYTSNPDSSTGDGIAMAWRAGCRVANMEFMQFHPTVLYHPEARSALISEAVRGEGGRLLLPDGQPFMHRFDAREELAPRDVVARAIDHEMKRLGADHLYLDISHKPADFIVQHFPNIAETCLEYGFDITKEPIPIVPAAHYTCGGVMTDLNGATDLPGLYAVGETSMTGLHGANRMASNSLLECLVFAKSSAEDISRQLSQKRPVRSVPEWDESQVSDSDEEVVVSHNWEELRRFMWDYVGIVRTDKRLARAKHRVDLLMREINEYYRHFRITPDLLELRHLVVVADLIIRSAQKRNESRGLHYTLDHPEMQPDAIDTILSPTEMSPPPWPSVN